VIRKFLAALILIPIALAAVLLAVANRQVVRVSFDPFDEVHPALVGSLPLYVLVLLLLIAGVILGGSAAWLRQSKWRRAARLAQAEARALRAERDAFGERSAGQILAASGPHGPPGYGPRLTIPPPAA
jgi:uncharacterized integral membrane protein